MGHLRNKPIVKSTLRERISNIKDRLERALLFTGPGRLDDLVEHLKEAREQYVLLLGQYPKSKFQRATFAAGSVWYEACHLLYKANRSDLVPYFFEERIPPPSRRVAAVSSPRQHAAGRRDAKPPSLFGGAINDRNAASILTSPPSKRRRI